MADKAEEKKDFEPTPEGWAQRWTMEIAAAKDALKSWHTLGDKIDKRLRDSEERKDEHETHWNLYPADVNRLKAQLYGRIPQCSVSRRFADANDDLARVGADIFQRLLNTDIERYDDGYCSALGNALLDYLGPGFGNARLRYVIGETEKTEAVPAQVDEGGNELAPEVPETEKRSNEQVETDYFNWKDQLWSPCRHFHESRWWSFLNQMGRDALVEKFGPDGKLVPLNSKRNGRDADDRKKSDPWRRADVWEIWDKENKKQFFFVEGFGRTLVPVGIDSTDGSVPDPLGLDGFYPFPKPMFANLTTSALVPVPDFHLAKDQYDEIDRVSSRITQIERAIAVKGVYDATNTALKDMLENTGKNQMFPVKNWAAFSEKGGFKGALDWLPIEQLAAALLSLRDYRRELIDALYQIRGTSDIMRGQATSGGATATEQRIKARFSSVVLQALQDEFARFASDLQRIKAEIIAKHFDASTILARCNCENTPDKDLAPQAVQLMQSDFAKYRIEVKPEAINFQDFAALKEERMEVLSAIGEYINVMGPLAQSMPGSATFLLEMLKVSVAGLRGASAYEGILDRAIAQAEQASQQAAQNPQQAAAPDPKVIAQQMKGQQDQAKGQMDMQKEQFKLQADLTRTQAEVQADAQREENQATWNSREAAQKALIARSLKPPDQNGGFP